MGFAPDIRRAGGRNLYAVRLREFGRVAIDVSNQTTSVQLRYFGTKLRAPDLSRFAIPLWAPAGIFFALVATIFVGLGREIVRGARWVDLPAPWQRTPVSEGEVSGTSQCVRK